MITNIDLFPNKPECSLTAFTHDDNKVRPAVIVANSAGLH